MFPLPPRTFPLPKGTSPRHRSVRVSNALPLEMRQQASVFTRKARSTESRGIRVVVVVINCGKRVNEISSRFVCKPAHALSWSRSIQTTLSCCSLSPSWFRLSNRRCYVTLSGESSILSATMILWTKQTLMVRLFLRFLKLWDEWSYMLLWTWVFSTCR